MASSANVEATEPKGRVEERAMDDQPIQKEMEERKKMKEMKKIRNTYKRIGRIMKEPEVKRLSDQIKYFESLEQPQRSSPCFPSGKQPAHFSAVKPHFYVQQKLYDPDCVLRYNHFGFLRHREMLIELVSKRLKEKERLRKVKKGIKRYMKRRRERDLKETKGVNLAETVQAKQDVGRLEDGHEKREELMLDVSASSQVDELSCRTSPYEQTGKLMEGLKSCTTEAGKKSASHAEGI